MMDASILNYVLRLICVQAESALDQMDWIEKITGVIASLLSSQLPERVTRLIVCIMSYDFF